MEFVALLFKAAPFLAFLACGIYALLEALIPSLRGADFNHWEIDEAGGDNIQILGWKKALSPPRVLASGYLSERSAVTVAICFGSLFILIGTFGIRHVTRFPGWPPDFFGFLQGK